jgi:hypothetical protein
MPQHAETTLDDDSDDAWGDWTSNGKHNHTSETTDGSLPPPEPEGYSPKQTATCEYFPGRGMGCIIGPAGVTYGSPSALPASSSDDTLEQATRTSDDALEPVMMPISRDDEPVLDAIVTILTGESKRRYENEAGKAFNAHLGKKRARGTKTRGGKQAQLIRAAQALNQDADNNEFDCSGNIMQHPDRLVNTESVQRILTQTDCDDRITQLLYATGGSSGRT